MNKYNCDSLKNLPVPDELIEKALAIPETAEKPAAVLPWYRQNRMIAAAASIMLVAVMGMTSFFLFGKINDDVIPVRKVITASETPSENSIVPMSENIDDTAATESTVAATEREKPTDRPSASESPQVADNRTAPPYVIIHQPATQAYAEGQPRENHPEPTQSDQRGTEQPAPVEQATENPAPTERATEKPAPVIQPTDSPVTAPTEPYTSAPTETPFNPQPWEFLLAPTGDIGDPTAPTSVPSGSMFAPPIYAHGSPDGLTGSGKVYCALYDVDGELMGGGELLSPERLTTVIWNRGGNLWLKYVVPQGILPDSGTYEIRLYNEDGREIARYTDYVVVPV